MNKKKVIQFTLIALLFLSLATTVVSAGFGDWLKGIFSGEPQLSPFNATVTIQSVAPEVIKVVNITDRIGSAVDKVDIIEGGINNAYVIFVAHDNNGKGDLPDTPGLGVGAGQISIKLQKPLLTKPALEIKDANVIDCKNIACDTNCDQPNLQKMYECNITGLQYYFEPSPDWFVDVSITDLSGSKSNNYNTKKFEYLPHMAISQTGSIAWDSVSTTTTNQKATKNLTITNKGNRDSSSWYVTAYNLTGASYPAQPSYIPASAIKAHGSLGTECTSSGRTLVANAPITIPGPTLLYGPAEQKDLYFCIWRVLTEITPPLYLSDRVYNTTKIGPWGFTYAS